MEMLLTGEPVSAQDALNSGLVNRVVPAEELQEATLSLARKVASAPTSTVSMGKSAFYRTRCLSTVLRLTRYPRKPWLTTSSTPMPSRESTHSSKRGHPSGQRKGFHNFQSLSLR